MKIAFFSDCYLDLTGGIVSSINAQKAELEKRGHTVCVFSSGYPKSSTTHQKLAKQNIYQVPSCKLFFRGFTPVSRRPRIIEKWLFREHPELKDFDVFYVHYESGCSIAGLRLAKKLNIPTVQVMHGREDMGESNIIPAGFRTFVAASLNWFHSWYLPHPVKVSRDNYLADTAAKAKMWTLMVNHANAADLVLTPSEHFRQKLMHYGVRQEIRVFPNGYADKNYPKNPTLRSFAPNESLRIIWHSRLSGEKRIIAFLKALSELEGEYYLDVFGDGPDKIKAEQYAKLHRLKVKFHGDVKFEKLKDSIEKAHLDVLTSYNYDTFGMTLIEAEAYGTPVFFCDPDMREVVPKGSFILSASESSEDMAKALDSLIDHPEKIAEMSKTMLAHREEVLISRRIEILEKAFSDIIKK